MSLRDAMLTWDVIEETLAAPRCRACRGPVEACNETEMLPGGRVRRVGPGALRRGGPYQQRRGREGADERGRARRGVAVGVGAGSLVALRAPGLRAALRVAAGGRGARSSRRGGARGARGAARRRRHAQRRRGAGEAHGGSHSARRDGGESGRTAGAGMRAAATGRARRPAASPFGGNN